MDDTTVIHKLKIEDGASPVLAEIAEAAGKAEKAAKELDGAAEQVGGGLKEAGDSAEDAAKKMKGAGDSAQDAADKLKKAGDASGNAAPGHKKQADALHGVGEAAGKTERVAMGLGGVFSLLSPKAGELARGLGDVAGGLDVVAGMGTKVASVLGPVAIAVGALALVYRKLAADAQDAADAQEAASKGATAAEGAARQVARQEVDYKEARGEITPKEAAALRADMDADEQVRDRRVAATEKLTAALQKQREAAVELASAEKTLKDVSLEVAFNQAAGVPELMSSSNETVRLAEAAKARAEETLREAAGTITTQQGALQSLEGEKSKRAQGLKDIANAGDGPSDEELKAKAEALAAFRRELEPALDTTAAGTRRLAREIADLEKKAAEFEISVEELAPKIEELKRAAALAEESFDFEMALAPLAKAPAAVTQFQSALEQLAASSRPALTELQQLRAEMDQIAMLRADLAIQVSRGTLSPDQISDAESTLRQAEGSSQDRLVASEESDMKALASEADRAATDAQRALDQRRQSVTRGVGVGMDALGGNLGGLMQMAGPAGMALGGLASIGELGQKGVAENLDGFSDSVLKALRQLPDIISETLPNFIKTFVPALVEGLIPMVWQLPKAIALALWELLRDLPTLIGKAIVRAMSPGDEEGRREYKGDPDKAPKSNDASGWGDLDDSAHRTSAGGRGLALLGQGGPMARPMSAPPATNGGSQLMGSAARSAPGAGVYITVNGPVAGPESTNWLRQGLNDSLGPFGVSSLPTPWGP